MELEITRSPWDRSTLQVHEVCPDGEKLYHGYICVLMGSFPTFIHQKAGSISMPDFTDIDTAKEKVSEFLTANLDKIARPEQGSEEE